MSVPWYEENKENILVEYLFENLSMDNDHELNNLEYGPVDGMELDRPDPEFIGGADYQVELTFSNADLDKGGVNQFKLMMIDQHGIAGYLNQIYGGAVEQEDGKGVRTSVYFSTHTECEKLLLYYTDSLLDRNEGFYIEIDEIN